MALRRFIGTAAQRLASAATGNAGDLWFESDTTALGVADGTTPLAQLSRLARRNEVASLRQGFLSAMGGRTIMWDDFSRSDRDLVGDVCPTTGRAYSVQLDASGPGMGIHGGHVEHNINGNSGSPILLSPLETIPTTVACLFFNKPGTAQGDHVLGCCELGFGPTSLQLGTTETTWELFRTAVDIPVTGTITVDGPSGIFTADHAHGLVPGNKITPGTITGPLTGLTPGHVYAVVRVPSSTTFTLCGSASSPQPPGIGTEITMTGTGSVAGFTVAVAGTAQVDLITGTFAAPLRTDSETLYYKAMTMDLVAGRVVLTLPGDPIIGAGTGTIIGSRTVAFSDPAFVPGWQGWGHYACVQERRAPTSVLRCTQALGAAA